jgi:hypothetical protein
VGNLLPGQSVSVRISYVTEVTCEGPDLRFCLPTAVAPRYTLRGTGAGPAPGPTGRKPSVRTRAAWDVHLALPSPPLSFPLLPSPLLPSAALLPPSRSSSARARVCCALRGTVWMHLQDPLPRPRPPALGDPPRPCCGRVKCPYSMIDCPYGGPACSYCHHRDGGRVVVRRGQRALPSIE